MIRVLGRIVVRSAMPVISILALWYLAILTTGLPPFVIPRPERVFQALVADRGLITHHLIETLKAAAVGYVLANVVGIGLAALLVAFPVRASWSCRPRSRSATCPTWPWSRCCRSRSATRSAPRSRSS